MASQQDTIRRLGNGQLMLKQQALAEAGKPPLTAQQAADFLDQHAARMEEQFRPQNEAQIVREIPSMARDGKFDPLARPDARADGLDAVNTLDHMTPAKTAAYEHLGWRGERTIKAKLAALDQPTRDRLVNGTPLAPEEERALVQRGVDVPGIRAAAAQAAYAKAALASTSDFGGNLVDAARQAPTPRAAEQAAARDPQLAAKVQEKVDTGEQPDFMTSLMNTWNQLGQTAGPLGQVLVGGGVALGTVGLLSSLLGEGGMGGILAALLGGGAAVAGLHQGGLLPAGMSNPINSALGALGLGHLASGGDGGGAQTPMTQEQLDAAMGVTAAPGAVPGAPGAPGAPGTPGAPGATPGAPGAAPEPAPALPDISQPEVRRDLMRMDPQQQTVMLARALQADTKGTGMDLAKATDNWWNPLATGKIMTGMAKAMPGVTQPEAGAIIEAFRRLPKERQEAYRAQYQARDRELAARGTTTGQ
jgi:hypothetical protein